MSDNRTLDTFLESLGSSAPTPGGGAASAVAGALAAALAEMVAQLTVGKPRFAAVEPEMRDIIAKARAARNDLLQLMTDDERAFQTVSSAYRMPRGTDDERATRSAAIQAALRDAMQPPFAIMRRASAILELALKTARAGNPSVASDAGCAAILAEAAVRAAGLNVLANVVLLRDETFAQAARDELAQLETYAGRLHEQTMQVVAERMRG
jgi:formiminotetrahydrofolate cyclodeaminase